MTDAELEERRAEIPHRETFVVEVAYTRIEKVPFAAKDYEEAAALAGQKGEAAIAIPLRVLAEDGETVLWENPEVW